MFQFGAVVGQFTLLLVEVLKLHSHLLDLTLRLFDFVLDLGNLLILFDVR